MSAWDFTPAFGDPLGSPIRELFPYLGLPGMISFAGGYPSATLFDAQGLQEASVLALGHGAVSLQYSATEGLPLLREALAQHSRTRGLPCEAADVLVTAGSQQAFDLLLRILVAPGDCVCVETPAYPAAIQALRLAGARIVPALTDAHGIDTAALRDWLNHLPANQKPKLLYTVPNFSNPGGTLLPLQRRTELVALAVERGFLIVEDDPYGELSFTNSNLPSLYALGAQYAPKANPVFYLSSLSKVIAPALRVGWLVAPPAVLRRCAIAKQTVDLCTSALTQSIAAHYLASSRYGTSLAHACHTYQERMLAMAQGLQAHLGGDLAFVQPQGGMFIWAQLKKPVDPTQLFQAAVQHRVLYVPGAAFYAENPQTQTLRLSYAAPDLPAIAQGVERLAQAFVDCTPFKK